MIAFTALILYLAAMAVAVQSARPSDLKARAHRQRATLHADRGALRFCHRHRQAHEFCTRRRLRFLRAEIRWTTRELAETLARMNPWPVPGWFRQQALCIYSHESGGFGWHANTGNGYQTGMQFLPSTWARAGGSLSRFASASREEIIFRAYVIWRQGGGSWHEWSTAGMCGLR